MKNGKDNIPDSIQGFGNAVIYFTAPIMLKLLDIITTAKFLQLGVEEGNPFIAWLMSIDMNLAYAISFFGGLSSFAILYLLKNHISKDSYTPSSFFFLLAFKVIYFILIGLSVYVVIHNLMVISYSDSRILV